MIPRSLEALLPPLKHMPWMTTTVRLLRADAVRAQLRSEGYELAATPVGRTLCVVMPRGCQVPPDVTARVRPHHAALLALLQHPAECEAVLHPGRWQRPRVTRRRWAGFPR